MGYYINLRDGSRKEDWLLKHGHMVESSKGLEELSSRDALVCFVDNGAFSAAAIIYSARELVEFNEPQDKRIKFWFVVPRAELPEVSNIPLEKFEY